MFQTISLDCSGCSPAAEQGPFCSVSVFQHGDYGGWKADYVDGDYNGAAFLSGGARNDDASAIKVHGDGCVAVCYESDDLGASGGWDATFVEGDDDDGEKLVYPKSFIMEHNIYHFPKKNNENFI